MGYLLAQIEEKKMTYGLLAQAQPSIGQALMDTLPLLAMIFAIYYFLYARPVAKEKEEHSKMTNGLIKGDKVVTIGGIVGEVSEIQEDKVVLITGKKSSLSVRKSAIKQKLGAEGA